MTTSKRPDADQMMPPPWQLTPRAYDQTRGTCPSCSSAEVTHLVIGMPAGPGVGADDPAWVAWVGCVHPGYTRRCEACGATWTPEQTFADLKALMIEADVVELEDLCDWLSSDYELDAWVITDEESPDHFEVGFGRVGWKVEFPVGAREFWNGLDDLHDEAESMITGDDEE